MFGPRRRIYHAASLADVDKLRVALATEQTDEAMAFHPVTGLTPLLAAVLSPNVAGIPATVRLLVQHGASVDTADRSARRDSPLHHAAARNDMASVEQLLKLGANPSATNLRGHTPLDVAWAKRAMAAARVLTRRLQVHSGWLDVSDDLLEPRWQRRWAVAVACGSHARSLELCLFANAEQVAPPAEVLRVSTSSQSISLVVEHERRAFVVSSVRRHRVRDGKPPRRHRFFGTIDDTNGDGVGLAALIFAPIVTAEEDAKAVEAKWLLAIGVRQPKPSAVRPVEAPPSQSTHETSDAANTGSNVSTTDRKEKETVQHKEKGEPSRKEAGDWRDKDCTVCMDAPRNAVCVPCGHVAACYACLQTLRERRRRPPCPICRAVVRRVQRLYDC